MKSARAAITAENMRQYHSHLSTSLEGVPASNIVNYDETAHVDDPQNRKGIYRRKKKYPVRECDFSKTGTSVMWACTGDGTLLPLYSVYKSKELCANWCQGGPRGGLYNRSNSGWFDSFIFKDWIEVR